MEDSYNLVDKPFIPCIRLDGRREELGLFRTLAEAHQIREIRDESPLVTVSLHRLLLAILHRNFGPESLDAWKELWKAGKFDAAALGRYFQTWYERFDLLHSEYPFYQTAHLHTVDPLPALCLFDQFSAGNNATLFDHSTDNDPVPLSLAQAARGVIARQTFSIGFGKSPNCMISDTKVSTGYREDAPLTRGITLLLLGTSLLQTLLRNLTGYADDSGKDIPAWERVDREGAMSVQTPFGRVDLYTWQPRRLRLLQVEMDEGQGISRVHFAQGRKMAKGVIDPMKPYKRKESGEWSVFPLTAGRALWRDSATLFIYRFQRRTARHPLCNGPAGQ